MSVLNTPQQIRAFQIQTTIRALELEIKTGLRHSRGSVLKAKTKKKALIELKEMLS